MKINRKSFVASLEAVSTVSGGKNGVVVLSGGSASAFDGEMMCSCPVPAGLDATVPADPLLALLRRLVEDELDVEVVEGELLVKGAKKKAGITLVAGVDMPGDAAGPDKWFPLPAGFMEAVDLVRRSASGDESQFKSTCVHLYPEGMEACDQYQVTRWPMKTGIKTPVLIRAKVLGVVAAAKPEEFGETEAWLHFKCKSGLIMACRRYVEKYPSLDRLLDVHGPKTKLPEGLEDAAAKAEVFSGSSGLDQVGIDLRPGCLFLEGRGPNGWYKEKKDVDYQGEQMKFMISAKLLSEVTRKAKECVLGEGRLKVQTDKFEFVCCLGKPEA